MIEWLLLLLLLLFLFLSMLMGPQGFIGYPNVGKSSTINKLLNSKKVRVSETPGKTKHFQVKYFYPKKINPIIFFTNF